jgi:membrane protein DedA with SNARE-associated domain
MVDIGALVSAWGYLAIFVALAFGSVGLPVPEEAVLLTGGYFAWTGQLELPGVIAVGIASAIAGDNIGYWLGRSFGCRVIALLQRTPGGAGPRIEAARQFLLRNGAVGVFLARFVVGLRFVAAPLAGAIGVPCRVFVVANALGAVAYVPIAVGLGYALGVGLRSPTPVLLAAVVLALATAMLWRTWRGRRTVDPEGERA